MKKKVIIILFTIVAVLQGSTASAFNIADTITAHPINIIDGVLDSECPEDLTFSFGESEVIVPITVCERGGLLIGVRKRCNSLYRNLNLQLYRDSSCTEPVGSSIEFSDDSFVSGSIECIETGTYYLQAKLLRADEVEEEMLFSLNIDFVSSVNRSLAEEEIVCGFGGSCITDYTFSLAQDGCIAFSLSGISDFLNLDGVTLDLLDSNGTLLKQEISIVPSGIEGKYSAVFSLKKGSYHVRVHSLVPYALSYSFRTTAVSAISCTKETARKIFFDKEYSEIIDNSFCNWFRFDLRKKQSVRIVCNIPFESSLNFELLDSDGCLVKAVTGSNGVLRIVKKCKKGTYYLRVSKGASSIADCYSFVLKS